jgi:DNA-binding NtrC family response regulator
VTIGVDVLLGQAGVSSRGAAGDALLAEATATAGTVVYPIAPDASTLPALAESAKAIGHTRAPSDPDGVVRRVPLFVQVGDRTVPAFGLALAAAFTGVTAERMVTERRLSDPARVPFAGGGLPAGVTVAPFSSVWTAIEGRQIETLEGLVGDRLVLVLAEPAGAPRAIPTGAASDLGIQAHLLHALLTGVTLRDTPRAWPLVATLLTATVLAWLWLRMRWWQALAGALVLVGAQAATVLLALGTAHRVLPIGPPLVALALASVAALTWNSLGSARRFRQLESENTRVRDALVRHESVVEALEEDLEAARMAVARSTGAERDLVRATDALRAQLGEARAQEEATRRHLAELERQLRDLRPAERPASGDIAPECEALGIVTRDPAVVALFGDLKKAAGASLPILLLGEPGTGKELFARAAHRLSPRASQPFVPVNVGAIPADLFESEMFGHVRGSFTGAVADRRGHFAEAHGGTLFLDEIGDLRPEHQVKLLRVLQEKTFYRVGTSRPTIVDVRVVAASNRDLERGVTEGWFREDLYFRLEGLVLRLPPLRERAGDIPLIAARLFRDIAAELGRPGLTLSEEAVAALAAHDWPGNVRELQNVLRQAATLADGSVVRGADLRLGRQPRPSTPASRPAVALDSTGDDAVLASLRQHQFDMQATGRTLGWDRSTVTQRLKGLGFRALVEAGGDRARAALTLAGDPALARTVEVKLREYHEHLLRSVEGFDSADAAVAACRRRFKNLPERHFRFLETLVRERFAR